MDEIFSQISSAADRVFLNIPTGWPYKLGMGLVLMGMQRHVALFTAFTALVFIDLAAKFIALSAGLLRDGGRENPSLYESIRGIPEAHRQGVISSWEMKTQFIGKIIVYLLLVTAGGLADILFGGGAFDFSKMMVAYCASTELLSIVENLDDAGVSTLHGLVKLIKQKGRLE